MTNYDTFSAKESGRIMLPENAEEALDKIIDAFGTEDVIFEMAARFNNYPGERERVLDAIFPVQEDLSQIGKRFV